MAQVNFGSAGVTAREIDLSGPVEAEPVGIPAGVIGTSTKGRAFVPITLGLIDDFYAKFGKSDGEKFGPLAVAEWLKNAQSVTYLRVLGCGNGKRRAQDGNKIGSVTNAGFTVGEEQPGTAYNLVANPYANVEGVPGRTHFLGCYMSESEGSTVFSSAGIQGSTQPNVSASVPIVRGIVMCPSGVVAMLSSSQAGVTNTAPTSTAIATNGGGNGSIIGTVTLLESSIVKQEFVMLLNGHKGTDPLYPNVITASFDMTAPNYFANVFNSNPLNYQKAGHYLYAHWDVHPTVAVVTGTGIIVDGSGSGGTPIEQKSGAELSAFLTTGSLARDTGGTYVPNYEMFVDRYRHAVSPWIISQNFGGSPKNLFKFHSIDDGAGVSDKVKISIENIVKSTDPEYLFGTFDVVVRDWSDTDGDTIKLEQFRGLSLDPGNDRYIAKVIGDLNPYYEFDRNESAQKLVIDGNYSNRSNYIRVEMSTTVENKAISAEALPMGFRGVSHLVTSGTMPMTVADSVSSLITGVSNVLKRTTEVPLPLRQNISRGTGVKKSVNSSLYWGIQFEHITSLTTPNASTLENKSLKAFAKYFPDFSTTNANFVVVGNEGAADTAQLGIVDADRFCNNKFTLENLQVRTSSAGIADSQEWSSASYVRNGNITADETLKTRGLTMSDLTQANRRFIKFTTMLQGGFDGVNIFDYDESKLNDYAVTSDMSATNRGTNSGPNVKAYTKAIEIMKNVVNTDIQLLAIPGIRHSYVTDTAIEAVEDRFDAMLIMDIQEYDQVNSLVTGSVQNPSVKNTVDAFVNRSLNSSFAAPYYPDVVIEDPNTLTNVVCPPSVAVLGAFALNDAVGHPWFAPAGFTRGALSSVLEAKVKLTRENMDRLYDAKINPLVSFPGNTTPQGLNPTGGVTVWGQKTIYQAQSALDRVNVRRLLIDVRRQVREVAQGIIFEPNRETTLAKFSARVTPRLQRVRALQGVEDFKVVIDSSTTTQNDIENNTIRGKIFLIPTRTIEAVSLDFVVTNPGTFDAA